MPEAMHKEKEEEEGRLGFSVSFGTLNAESGMLEGGKNKWYFSFEL